jgi:hypothetical protein
MGVNACDKNSTSVVAPNAVPKLESVAPGRLLINSGARSADVFGSDFTSSSRVRWNRGDRPTTFVSSTHLRVDLRAEDLATLGIDSILVYSPPPGGGSSPQRAVVVGYDIAELTSISPNRVVLPAPTVVVTIIGRNFGPGTIVYRNGAPQPPPQFVSTTELRLTLDSFVLAEPTVFTLGVANPGDSPTSTLPFSIEYPVPTIEKFGPDSIFGGASTAVVEVEGTGYFPKSQIAINGQTRTTSVDDSRLATALTAADLTNAAPLTVTVVNPSPGGGSSASVSIRVFTNGPRIARTLPTVARVAAGPLELKAVGAGFGPASFIRWNGSAMPTTFRAPDSLVANIPASLVLAVANVSLTVVDPVGGQSAPFILPILPATPTITRLQTITQSNFDVVYDSTRDHFYFSTGSQVLFQGRILARERSSGQLLWEVALPAESKRLVITDDGAYLYATLDNDFQNRPRVARVDLARRVLDTVFVIPDPSFGAVAGPVPGAPRSFLFIGTDARLSVYDDGAPRPLAVPNVSSVVGVMPGVVFANTPGNSLAPLRITTAGLVDDLTRIPGAGSGSVYNRGLVVNPAGTVIDTDLMSFIGRVAVGGVPLPDAANGRVHFFVDLVLRTYHARSLDLIAVTPLADATGTERSMFRIGRDGLAFKRGDGILILHGNLVAP